MFNSKAFEIILFFHLSHKRRINRYNLYSVFDFIYRFYLFRSIFLHLHVQAWIVIYLYTYIIIELYNWTVIYREVKLMESWERETNDVVMWIDKWRKQLGHEKVTE